MKRLLAALRSLGCAVWLAACAAAVPALSLDEGGDEGPPRHAVFVVSNGWHSAIVVARQDLIETGLVPEAADFPDAAFLEFGWGDRTYYPARDKTVGLALAAALTATPAVMHLAGLAAPPERLYPDADVARVALTEAGLRRLVAEIDAGFERPEGGRAAAVSRGLYRDSNFYLAHGEFHLFNTCNTWTARTLRAGGVGLSPSGVITADALVRRLRKAPGVSFPEEDSGRLRTAGSAVD